MFLAKALKYKNRIAERISKVSDDIAKNNSTFLGQEVEVDVLALLSERAKLVNAMIDLKMAIDEANKPIKRLILVLSEKKSEIAFLRMICTLHGKIPSQFGLRGSEPSDQTYHSVIRRATVDEKISNLEKDIDCIQEQIEAHNHSVKIDVVSVL